MRTATATGAPPARPALRLVPGTGSRPRCRPTAAAIRRRRLVVALAAVTVVLMAKAWTGAHDSAVHPVPAQQMIPASERSHVVQPGDTLWKIARGLEQRGDVRPVVDRLAKGRQGQALRVGERIVLP
jgi:nucleoid-associated protein YgaU